MNKTTVDITPSPKILQVLGEIELRPWQCVAELIDNSVDGFLSMERQGTPIAAPEVNVAFGRESIKVIDNGPGMALDDLELAVKAGWSNQDKFGSLGLYGIGFNIATARLGSITTIWTTRVGDSEWYGLTIDLKKLAKSGSYSLNVKTRSKSDSTASGTEIEVSELKADWRDQFLNANWVRPNITERLARVYGAMLRDSNPQPIKFTLLVNTKKVMAWEHCVWPDDWAVFRKNEGFVRPVQEFDQVFGIKYMSRSTGEFYESPDEVEAHDLIEVPERVYGWIGIQRYADETDFGIDVLRNGRKIEVGCKDIFDFEFPDGKIVQEYPQDDPRGRARIVGEIHLDHGYVHYTKHRFEREHASWKQLLTVVRANEPLARRDKANLQGVNESPLGTLFRVFRRNSPLSSGAQKYSDILFIKNNDLAKSMAQSWRKKLANYRDDQKWREELDKSDAPPAPPTVGDDSPSNDQTTPANSGAVNTSTSSIPGLDPNINAGSSSAPASNDSSVGAAPNGASSGGALNTQPAPASTTRQKLSELDIHVAGIGVTGKSYDVETYEISASDEAGLEFPWRSTATTRGVYEIDINPKHAAFKSTSLKPRDAVLAEVAHIIASEETASVGSGNSASYGEILVALRSRFPSTDSLEVNRLRMDIEAARDKLSKRLASQLDETTRESLLNHLTEEDIEAIRLRQVMGPADTSAIEYLEARHLALLFDTTPQTFFDAGCFKPAWTPPALSSNPKLLVTHRERLKRDIGRPFTEIGDFVSNNLDATHGRTYLELVRACVNRVAEYMSE